MATNEKDLIEFENLNLGDGEDDVLAVSDNEAEEPSHRYDFALVGTFLTKSVIYFEAMRNNLASYWKPEHGVEISELGANRYLFEFFHEVDLENVLLGGPYHFNNHLLLANRIHEGDDPLTVPLIHSNMWIQVHGLRPGSFSENMAKLLGNFVGKFIEYDASSLARGNRDYMRIRVQIDVRVPLKRKKKVAFGKGIEGYVFFRYEKLTLLCFLCGRLGHHDRVCPRRFEEGGRELPLEWGIELRAASKKETPVSPWLRIGGVPVTGRKSGPNLGVVISPKNLEHNSADINSNDSSLSGGILGDISNIISDRDKETEMEHDGEDCTVEMVDPKKRQRINSVAQVSEQDSKVAYGLPKAQSNHLSAGLGSQARRSK